MHYRGAWGFAELRDINTETDGNTTVSTQDVKSLRFLDHWRPPAYLVAEPNQAAADHIRWVTRFQDVRMCSMRRLRSMLITKYGHYLKA